jgi:hypothetical protein
MVGIGLSLCWAAGADALCPLGKFPATGQTTCYDTSGTVISCTGTGQDGDIHAGKALRYEDKGNGTVLDRNTRLVWEKKSRDGSIHDRNDGDYTWATALGTFVPMLNNRCANDESIDCTANGNADCAAVGGKCGFAGHRDWRLPNAKELQSIIDYEPSHPAVASAFNNGCSDGCTVLTCSCTFADGHWSSTTVASNSDQAWRVDFGFGNVSPADKAAGRYGVRAVRGGCVD